MSQDHTLWQPYVSLKNQNTMNLELLTQHELKLTQTIRHCNEVFKFYVYGSIHRWSILINVQRDATQSSLFIILQVRSTCFECQQRPSSGVHKTVTTASGTGQASLAMLEDPVLVIFFVQLPHATLEGGSGTKKYDQYRRLYLQFCVLPMMGAVDTRNM